MRSYFPSGLFNTFHFKKHSSICYLTTETLLCNFLNEYKVILLEIIYWIRSIWRIQFVLMNIAFIIFENKYYKLFSKKGTNSFCRACLQSNIFNIP